jgi:hypothetical protein
MTGKEGSPNLSIYLKMIKIAVEDMMQRIRKCIP